MPTVCAARLGFSYSDRVGLFENVNFRLDPGWYGLVGANGLGKTTLARLIAGELTPTAGRLWLEPKQARVVICRQNVDQLSADIDAFARSNDKESHRLRGLLRLDAAALGRWASLSPGERKRWQIAGALASAPDVLILDESTNHLDGEGRQFLLTALGQFDGVGIAISHDRELLARITRSTLRLCSGTVAIYALSYAEARNAWLAEETRAQAVRAKAVERARRVEQRLDTARRDQASVQRQRSAKNRMKNLHDHDGNSAVRTGRADFADARLSRNVRLLGAEHERAVLAINDFVVDKTLGRSIFVDYEPAPKPRILGLDGVDLYAGNTLVLRDVRVSLGRQSRVHLRGPNGAGKTTLLNALRVSTNADARTPGGIRPVGSANGADIAVGARSPISSRVLYLPQELSEEAVQQLLVATNALPRTERGRLMSILAALGVDPERVMASSRPSPGEARKLSLALGLGTYAWALLLDEPTNHLDLPSVERLEQALGAYPGAILLVTHDPQLARSCTNEVWEIEGQRVGAK